MDVTIYPRKLQGTVEVIPSKSQAHRLLICAALGEKAVTLRCDGLSKDIEATANCLRGLGADIAVDNDTLRVTPIAKAQRGILPCGESGSTLRFLLPVAAALGAESTFHMEGRLPRRPLAPLDEQLQRHGVTLTREGDTLTCCGQLTSGAYTLPGNISSQYISGLLFALPLLEGDSTLHITGTVESAA
jgi:3-phosphoshikimate 1-carboxyvinyltransferase